MADSGRRLRLLAAGLLVLLAGCRSEPPPNVLIITVDTLRADHCGCYGYERDTTPALDRLAEGGTVFDRAFAPLPRTTQALATLLTGRGVFQHDVLGLRDRLGDDRLRLPQIFRQAGYATAAFMNHPLRLLESAEGGGNLGLGFDPAYRGGEATKRGAQWLEGATEPFLLWVHLFDPHWEYRPGPDCDRFTDPEYDRERFRELVDRSGKGAIIFQNDWEPEDRRHAMDLYDGAILTADRKVARLIEALGEERRGRTLVTILADHGEGLGEHDYFYDHGERLFDEVIRVPWVLAGPGTEEWPERSAEPVELADVAPTLLELSGLPIPPDLRGRDLAPILRAEAHGRTGTKGADRPILGLTDVTLFDENPSTFMRRDEGRHRFVRSGGWKLIQIPQEKGRDRFELYDLNRDPGETSDRSEAEPEQVSRLARLLEEHFAEHEAGLRNRETPRFQKEVIRSLRTLGYMN